MTPSQIKTSKQIRMTGVAEGVSYLVLLLIAMPLKYYAGIPGAVKVVGWIHGLLFVGFMYMILMGWSKLGWSLGRMVLAFIMSLLPFGTFWLDRKLKAEEVKGSES
jgi:integral membrane protein